MKPAEVLKKMRELREAWRKQGFSYTKEQKAEYENLRQIRRERVHSFYQNGRVFKGSSKQTTDTSK